MTLTRSPDLACTALGSQLAQPAIRCLVVSAMLYLGCSHPSQLYAMSQSRLCVCPIQFFVDPRCCCIEYGCSAVTRVGVQSLSQINGRVCFCLSCSDKEFYYSYGTELTEQCVLQFYCYSQSVLFSCGKNYTQVSRINIMVLLAKHGVYIECISVAACNVRIVIYLLSM